MIVAVIAFLYIPIDTETLVVESNNISWPGILVLVTIICYDTLAIHPVSPLLHGSALS